MKKKMFYFWVLFLGYHNVLSQKSTFQYKDEFGRCSVVFLSESKLQYSHIQDLTTSFTAKYKIVKDTISLMKIVDGYKSVDNIQMTFSYLHNTLYVKSTQNPTYIMTLLPLINQEYRRK
jgi:hypothetical protein